MRKEALPILALLMVAAFTLAPRVAANPSFTPAYVGQSCTVQGVMQKSVGCTLPSLQVGETILVEVGETQPPILTDSMGDHFTVLREVPYPGSTYDLDVFLATVSQSGNDLVNIASNGNFPMLIAHGIYGAMGVEDTSSNSGNIPTTEVPSFAPLRGTLVIAASLIMSDEGAIDISVSAGPGYTLLTTGGGMADEDAVASGSTTTAPFTLGATANWAEIAVAFYPAAPVISTPQFDAPTVLVAAVGLLLVAAMKRSNVLKF